MTGVFPNYAPIGAETRLESRSYRHLLAQVRDHTPYGGHPGGPKVTEAMLLKLASRMSRPIPVGNMQVGWPNSDNPAIPSGYTYLAQLVAHDLVQNAASLPPIDGFAGQLQRDYRVQRLVLDTIYGSGPGPGALHFDPSRSGAGRDYTLRLGHVRPTEVHPGAEPLPLMTDKPARDIARSRCPFRGDVGGAAPGLVARNGMQDALIADLRNDDHLIISQLTALFHDAHNAIFRKLLGRDGAPSAGSPRPDQLARTFLEARKVLAFVYRRIVVLDLLSKLLDPDVYETYRDQKRTSLDPATLDDIKVPVEFSHAAYRFGHVMTRFSYVLNDELRSTLQQDPPLQLIMDRSSSRRADLVPLASTWLVDWSRFFDLGDGKPLNLSRRITPYVGNGFFSDSQSVTNMGMGVKGGLFYLDLLRGYQAQIASVDSLIDGLKPEDRERSPLLAEQSLRQNEIGKWLTHHPTEFDSDELIALTKDPPLLFFVLFEAAFQHEGARLGTLGSTMLAEMFLISMKQNEAAIEQDPAIGESLRAVFGDKPPTDMPGLIRFVKAEGGLKPVVTS